VRAKIQHYSWKGSSKIRSFYNNFFISCQHQWLAVPWHLFVIAGEYYGLLSI